MSRIPPDHFAKLSHDVYGGDENEFPFEKDAELQFDDRKYRILEIVDNDRTGYQGAIYQDLKTGALVVAHRGTEFDREAIDDGLRADGQMVMQRANLQIADAEALTQHAMRMAKDREFWPDGVTAEPEVLQTGHSLGGFLAEQQAAKHGHGGASFNGFGAAGIGHAPMGQPSDAPPFTAYARASDPVGTSSPHYGTPVHFATEADVAWLNTLGARPGTDGPAAFFAKAGLGVADGHSITNFTERGLMTDANRERYLDHQPQFAEQARSQNDALQWGPYLGLEVLPHAQHALENTPGRIEWRAGAAVGAVVAGFSAEQAPKTPEPLQRFGSEAMQARLHLEARLQEQKADLIDVRAESLDTAASGINAVSRGFQQTAGAVAAHVDDAVAAQGRATADAYRAVGGLAQGVSEFQARALDTVGLDGWAEATRERGAEARVVTEGLAQRVEANTRVLREVIDGGRVTVQQTLSVTDAVSKPLAVHAAESAETAEQQRESAERLRQTASALPEALHGANAPNLDMRATAREKITALYVEHNRPMPTTEQLDRMSAAVVSDARGQGMNRIDTVMFSQGKGNGPNYEGNLIVFDRDPMNEFSKHCATPIGRALETSVEQSVERTRAANERQEQFQFELQQMQTRDQAMKESQGMSMRIGARTMEGPGEGAAAGGDGGGG